MAWAAHALDGRLHTLRGGQSLVLGDPSRCWLVRSGAMAVLSTALHGPDANVPKGPRRYLFEALPGEALFGAAPSEASDHLSLMGIASGPTEVLEIELDALTRAVKAADTGAQQAVERWIEKLGEFLADDLEVPATLIRPDEMGELELGSEEVLGAPHNEMIWLRVTSGELHLLGDRHSAVTAEDGDLLIGRSLWVKAQSEYVELRATSMPGPDDAELPPLAAAVAQLHRLFNAAMVRLAEDEERAELARRELSDEQRRLKSHAAFQDLSSVLNPRERFELRDDPLLTAVGVVGQVQGITIEPIAKSEDLSRVSDPLEAIARASKIRFRKVLLWPGWESRDSGPLLAYVGADVRRPVALLPRGSHYDVVDPDRRVREPMSPAIEEELCPDAYMLYRALPDKVAGVFDLLRFIAHGRLWDMLYVLAVGISATLLGMIPPKAIGTLVDAAVPSADTTLLYQLAMILGTAAVAGAVLSWTQMMATVRTSTISSVTAQSAMWDRLLKFRPSFFRLYSSGDLQTRVNAVSEISRELSGATLRPLISGVLSLLNFALLWYFSWELAKIGIWVALVVLLFSFGIGYLIRRHSWRLHELAGAFNGLLISMIGGVGKLRVAGAEHRAFNHWVGKYTEQLRLTLRVQRLGDAVGIFNSVLALACSAFVFWRGAKLIVGEAGAETAASDETLLSIGDFLSFNTAFLLFLGGVTDISNTLVGILDTVVKGRRIQPLLEGEPEVSEEAADPGRLTGDVRLDNVAFRYHEDGPLILDRFSCEVKAGEFVAFVGPSGSGKSTVLRLLLGFERPESGRVLYDGQDVAGLDVLAVRRQIGSVLQNGRVAAGSIFENIANNAKVTHAEAWDAIADAGFTGDIEDMPMGLHTVVSEGGSNLSGGQRQRLLIARALVARPRIVFFDEATSALDNKTQATVSGALDRRKVTRVVIAHRLSTIRHADRIYVVEAGRIVQQGSFAALAKQEGLFRDLMARQMV